MKTLLATIITFFAISSQAATWGGQNCGLFDSTEELGETSLAQVISHKTVMTAQDLTESEKQKVVEVVSWNYNEKLDFETAMKDFTEIEGFVMHLAQADRELIYVGYYPGDNEYGLIYVNGSTEPLASVSDTDVACF